MFNAASNGRIPRMFEASVRDIACRVASYWSRIFRIIGTFTAKHMISYQAVMETIQSIEFRIWQVV